MPSSPISPPGNIRRLHGENGIRGYGQIVPARIACSSWSRRIVCLLEHGLLLVLGEQPTHGRHLAHLDGVAVEAGQDTVQPGHIAVLDERLPPVKAAAVRLAGHVTAEPLEVALDDGTPLLQAVRGQADRQAAVESPGSPLGAGEIGDDGPAGHFEAVAHAGQQPVELVIAQLDRPGQELTDAGLVNAAEAGQLSLGGARFAHHLTEQIATSRHTAIIASNAIACAPRLVICGRLILDLLARGLRSAGRIVQIRQASALGSQ